MVAQFIAKTINSKRPTYFLSLMSCSINKLKSHMLFTCKKFSDLTWERKFSSRKWWGEGEGGDYLPPPGPPFSTVLMKSQFKNKSTQVSICWITNTNINRRLKGVGINSYLFYWKWKIIKNHNNKISVATWNTYFSLCFIYSQLGSTLCYVLWSKKNSIICTTFLLLKTS